MYKKNSFLTKIIWCKEIYYINSINSFFLWTCKDYMKINYNFLSGIL